MASWSCLPENRSRRGAAKGDYVAKILAVFPDLTFRPKKIFRRDMGRDHVRPTGVPRYVPPRWREGIFTPPSEQGTLVFPATRDV